MNRVRLFYAGSFITRHSLRVEHVLEFFIQVENLGYRKDVRVVWAGEDGVWRELKARYDRPAERNRELWHARTSFDGTHRKELPGKIQFALRYRVNGSEYWDNNKERNYSVFPEFGLTAPEEIRLIDVGYAPVLERGQKTCPITVAIRRSVNAGRVGIVWTTDGWKTRHDTRCAPGGPWRKMCRYSAGVPGSNGWQLWNGNLEPRDSFRIEYAVYCDTGKDIIWDNNFGRNYLARRESLKILTLNLHCYQEENQDEKFGRIAKAIDDLNIGVVCLQEVGERWSNGKTDYQSNAARIIREKLRRYHGRHYHLHADSSHIGFDKYLEGSAILSKYRFLSVDSGYVSATDSIYDIHSRKVVAARIHVPYIGYINLFSVHLSWWSNGFRQQFENLKRWTDAIGSANSAATLLCGDFNSPAGSDGYALVTSGRAYSDQFLAATAPNVFHKLFGRESRDWGLLQNDHRIDYIFQNREGRLKPVFARTIFMDEDYGRVSDHPGYMVEFEPQ